MTGRLVDYGPEVGDDALPLELCTGETAECPHYACPDGWHAGAAPNCSCTPDCALEDEDDDWRTASIFAGMTRQERQLWYVILGAAILLSIGLGLSTAEWAWVLRP